MRRHLSTRRRSATLAGLALALCLALLPATGNLAAAADPIALVINGRVIPTDVPPVLLNGRVLVPLRVVSQSLGAQVDWNQASRTAIIRSASTTVALKAGSSTATVDGKPVSLDVPARIIGDRMMVPVRFVSQTLGATVDWDQARRQVIVSLAGQAPAVEGLSWEASPGVARFVIITNGPVHYQTSTRAPEPLYPNDRLLVEIDNAACNVAPTTPVGQAGVKQIRSYRMESAPITRVIFDLEEPVRYNVWATWDQAPPLGLGDLPAQFAPGQAAIVVEVEYRVLGVEFVNDPGAERVVVHMNGPADYRVWEAANPWRLVVDARRVVLARDLAGLSNADRMVAVGRMGVERVRYAQFSNEPDVARVVLDAPGGALYNVVRERNDIVIYLGGTITVTGFGYERVDTGGHLEVWAGRPLKPTVTRATNPDRLLVQFRGARLGGQIAGGGTVSYGDDLVLSVDYAEDRAAQTVTFAVNLRGAAGAKVTTTAEGVALDIGRSPLAGKKIVIDPGHGGTDPGAIADNGLREADLTPIICGRLAELLRSAGAEVTLTRTTSAENPDKYARPELANSIGADVLVAVHLNANNKPAVCGSETYYYHQESRLLAELIQSRLLDELGRPDGGVRWADFVVTREAHMPSCLVEALYMTNPTDLALLMNQDTLYTIAKAIFEGLEDYFAAR